MVQVIDFEGIDVGSNLVQPRGVLGQDTLSPCCLLSTKNENKKEKNRKR